ncbi:MAG TPA: pitrilysin family protein [Pyrinomonadaceae bacterium]|nr:pitrilysin family protein [Pyrinomonadaceae bacterium]
MRSRRLFAIVLTAGLVGQSFMPTVAWAQRRSMAAKSTALTALPPIKFTEFKLANGLRVIMHEDHSTPIVGVNLWYHVGSKNEVLGKTGYAHLFEHMMFQGSKHYDDNYFNPIQEAGGTLNGSTNTDRTNYWELVPSNFLETALFMEADRMGGLLDVLNEAKLANQRDVVKNEKRQNYDNRPYGLVGAKINETLYPADHPYHWLTIGSLDDLTKASIPDISDFFRRFYTPNNASLAIAGDFNPQQAKRWVEKYFGSIPRGPAVPAIKAAQPVLTELKRIEMQDRVSLPRLYLVWTSQPQFTADEPATDTLATILGAGKTSRLYKTLVYEKQIAQQVNVNNNSQELAGQFQVVATPKPGHTLDELEAAINEEIEKLKQTAPTAEELDRAYNAREARMIYGLQTVGGFGGKNDQLNQYATFLGQPDYFRKDLERYRNVTADDVKRVAQQYLTDKRIVVTVKPMAGSNARSGRGRGAGEGGAAEAAGDTSAAPVQQPAGSTQLKKTSTQTKEAMAANLPKAQADPVLTLPRIQRRKLSNGLEVLIVEQHELPVVNMNLVIKSGAANDPTAMPGLASITADLWDEGTKSRKALELSESLAAIGARLNVFAGWDSTSANLLTLTRQLDRALELYADTITNPAFDQKEFDLLRAQRRAQLLQQRDNANAIAGTVYASLLYGPEHPYGHPLIGTEGSLGTITDQDVQRFYESYYRPNNAALIVVGDVNPAQLIPKLEKALSGWKAGRVPAAANVSAPAPRDRATLYIVDKPGAAQSVIQIGQVGVARSTADYFPLLVMNSMLGGAFVSRVNLNLREDKGYTYGARTSFDYRRGPGPFTASAGVFTNVTKESVVEFLKELRGIRGDQPISETELNYFRESLIRSYPRGFETPEQIAGRLSDLVLYGLPDDYFNNYIAHVKAVTLADVTRVARQYVDPSRMAIVIVGDRKVIEPGLRSITDVGSTVTVLDMEGHPSTTTDQQ